MTSGVLFIFSKFWFPARYWGKKAKNDPKWQKSLLGYQPTLKYWLYLFLPRSSEKPVRPPTFMCNPPQNFEELDSPFEMYPCPKKQRLILRETKDLFSTMKWEHIWMLKYEYTVAKSKNQRELGFFQVFYFCSVARET